MKSRDSADVALNGAVSGNPFFVAVQIRLTTAKTQVETTETLFGLLSVQDCWKTAVAGRWSGQGYWKIPNTSEKTVI